MKNKKTNNPKSNQRNQRKEEIMPPHAPQIARQALAGATPREPSILASLRSLVPQRPLSPGESIRIAELQANRLLQHFQIETPAVPEEIVSELPRIRIVRERCLPVSGSAHWNGRHWIVTLSADEHPCRQRFSLMHEFKHVLDHTTRTSSTTTLRTGRPRSRQSASLTPSPPSP